MATTTDVTKLVKKLNQAQLDAAAAFIADLLTARDGAEQDQEEDGAGQNGKAGRGAGGWEEHKTINGHGPYAYWRWRDGKRMRSKYLGKVKDLGSASVLTNGKVAP